MMTNAVADELLCNRAMEQARQLEHAQSESNSRNSREEQMVDIILLLMVIASAISLLVVSPRDLQRRAILALREYEGMELSCTHGRGEDGEARAIPSTDWPDVVKG
jgi:hypothetical protein